MYTKSITLTPRQIETFWSRVEKTETCWNWTGPLNKAGYGQAFGYLAHRIAYTLTHGPIPEGLTLDHLCRNRRCCNPDHTEPVTHQINSLRGETIAARNAAKTHCNHGHPFTETNTYHRSDGRRMCKACQRASKNRTWRAYRDRIRARSYPDSAKY